MSVHPERGLLYVPTSKPSSGYLGGRRLGVSLFAESPVCLYALTGERHSAFQAVGDDVWDYDFGRRYRDLDLSDAVANESRPDDLPRAFGATGHRYHDGLRVPSRSRRVRQTAIAGPSRPTRH